VKSPGDLVSRKCAALREADKDQRGVKKSSFKLRYFRNLSVPALLHCVPSPVPQYSKNGSKAIDDIDDCAPDLIVSLQARKNDGNRPSFQTIYGSTIVLNGIAFLGLAQLMSGWARGNGCTFCIAVP